MSFNSLLVIQSTPGEDRYGRPSNNLLIPRGHTLLSFKKSWLRVNAQQGRVKDSFVKTSLNIFNIVCSFKDRVLFSFSICKAVLRILW